MLYKNYNDLFIRPNFVNKGKQQRDRRKLREKRRSTGVVHLQSTEVFNMKYNFKKKIFRDFL